MKKLDPNLFIHDVAKKLCHLQAEEFKKIMTSESSDEDFTNYIVKSGAMFFARLSYQISTSVTQSEGDDMNKIINDMLELITSQAKSILEKINLTDEKIKASH